MPATQKDLTPRDRLAVALDLPSEQEALKLVDRLGQTCQWFKVGMELYYAAGNSIVQQHRDRGFDVFLDLKLHDIPNTVAGAVRSATRAGASLLTIHASGGGAMMDAGCYAVHMVRLLAIPLKSGRTEYELDARQPEVTVSCVRALFPHQGYQPCWYVRRNSQKPIPMMVMIAAKT